MTEEGFRGPQVCSIVGITYRQLDYWARTGLLGPSISSARGSGSQRRYSYRDLIELKVIKQLLDAGVSLQSARKAIDCLNANLGVDLASANLVLGGAHSVMAKSGSEVVDLLAGGQGVLNIVPLGSVVQEVDAGIVAMRAGLAPSAPDRSGAGDPGGTAGSPVGPSSFPGVPGATGATGANHPWRNLA
ncbi:MAG: MerR family transcriptional regulator [Acidimicrobiales bacterium]